jgi:hypothetical protein
MSIVTSHRREVDVTPSTPPQVGRFVIFKAPPEFVHVLELALHYLVLMYKAADPYLNT